jgi:hypothetical protein
MAHFLTGKHEADEGHEMTPSLKKRKKAFSIKMSFSCFSFSSCFPVKFQALF